MQAVHASTDDLHELAHELATVARMLAEDAVTIAERKHGDAPACWAARVAASRADAAAEAVKRLRHAGGSPREVVRKANDALAAAADALANACSAPLRAEPALAASR